MLITRCRLVLHDSLYYATREMGTLYETERYLHNYALSYALFGGHFIHVPYFASGCRPRYHQDLEPLNERGVYVTPARPVRWDYWLVTWKMAQVAYYRRPERFGARGNFPENYGRAKELAPESEFELFVVSREAIELPRWIRMGKWASKILVTAGAPLEPTERTGVYVSSIPLNPLDATGKLTAYDVISMPPVSLVNNARLDGPFYELADGTRLPAGMSYTFPEGQDVAAGARRPGRATRGK
jgi:CRISPR-associated protein Csc1